MIIRKGIDLLLTAFDRLVREGLDLRLDLVGRKAELDLFLRKISSDAKKHIRYLGFLQPSELPEIFARADVFVLPSRHDGWGVVVNQALGAGLPIISSTGACAGIDLVQNNVSGIHVPNGGATELADAMGRLARNPEIRMRMAQAAVEKASTITPAIAAKHWVEVLENLADDKPTGSGVSTSDLGAC